MRAIPYTLAVRSLMYVMLYTRLGICFAISMVSRYQSSLGPPHWVAVKHTLKYLRKTRDFILVYNSEDFITTCYTILTCSHIVILEDPHQGMSLL